MAAINVDLKRIIALIAVIAFVCLLSVNSFKACAETFDESDYEEYMALPDKITADDCETVERLYLKLLESENAEDYNSISSQLREKYVIARGIESEINYINMIIDTKLTPSSEISLSESLTLEEVITLGNRLDESGRQRITDWDGLLKRQKELAVQKNVVYALGMMIPLSAGVAIFIFVVKRQKLKENNADN